MHEQFLENRIATQGDGTPDVPRLTPDSQTAHHGCSQISGVLQ
jgi:hypothetical protein